MDDKTSLDQEADRFIGIIAPLMSGRLEREALSLSRGEFGVLTYLSAHTGGVTSGMIGEALRIGPGGVANLLKSLEKKRLICKQPDPDDRRANSVTATPLGLERLAARYAQIKRSVLLYMEQLGLEEVAAFNDTLARILEISLHTELPD